MSTYGTDRHDFERLTGLKEGSKVVFYKKGDEGLSVGIIYYHTVGAGFDIISVKALIDSKHDFDLCWETNGYNNPFNSIPKDIVLVLDGGNKIIDYTYSSYYRQGDAYQKYDGRKKKMRCFSYLDSYMF